MLNKNEYEEIANIPEAIADGIVIDGEEKFEEDSIVEVDLMDFEELGAVDVQSMKSSTIIDEFEDKNAEKDALRKNEKIITDINSSINIQKLSIQIDGLTTVKKNINLKKHAEKNIPSKQVIPPVKEEKKGYIKERQKGEQYEEISPVKKELKQEEISEIKDIIKESIRLEFEKQEQERNQENKERLQAKELFEERAGQEFAEPDVNRESRQEVLSDKEVVEDNFQETILKQYEEIEKKYEEIEKKYEKIERKYEGDIAGSGGIESVLDEIGNNLNIGLTEDIISENSQESPEKGGNSFTIEIPDKLKGELPADFNIDELGKIDLNEAETMAEEDFLSLAKGDLLEELEELDVLPEQSKEVYGNEEKEQEKTEGKKIKKADVAEKKDGVDQEEKNEKSVIPEKSAVADAHKEPVRIKPEEIIIEEDKPDKEATKEGGAIINVNPENQRNQPLQDNSSAGKVNENAIIIDSENISAEYSNLHMSVDELENISSSIADVIEGEAKQLTESETTDRKAVTGLIRDNYPTFKDLLKEKELEEQHIYFDDDIAFVDTSFIKEDQIRKSSNFQTSPEEDAVQSKTPYEQMLGLIPDEIELIEDQLFKIKDRKINLKRAENIYHDQPPEDTLALEKFKYILPVPDSLLDNERKSIEDEISAKSALIFEEDVDKIKKKLEDSMEKKIKDTIQDITGKITIYEDNKKQNKTDTTSSEKEDIKRLLKYLDELLESLPEKSINKFANSDYYELYKKVFKDLDI